MRLFCTIAALAIFAVSVGDAIYTASQPRLDDTVTGSISHSVARGSSPASYGLRYRPDVRGF